MKKTILVALLSLVGCAQLQHGQEQPVISKLSKEKGEYYFTTCAGAVEGWSDCYQKASQACNKQYVVLDIVDNNRGPQRDFTFPCK